MDSKVENGVLTINLIERVDSNNANDFEKEIDEIIEQSTFDELLLDGEKLAYISSAGLRVILRLKKKEPSLKVINVSSDVYEIFDMTGFTEVLTIEKAYRKMSVDGCEIIGKGAKGTVYRLNEDTIIKVYNDPDSLADIHKERELARKAFVLGIPTAISYDVVKVGDSFGSVFELLDAKSFSQLIVEDPDNLEKYAKEYAYLLRQIPETPVKASDMPDAKKNVWKWLDIIANLKFLPEETLQQIRSLVEQLPDTLTMIHGDYHTNNLMMQNGETLLIDMDTLSHGHPIFDLMNVFFTYVGQAMIDPEVVKEFTGIDADTALKVWKAFIPAYLGTDDEATIDAVSDKIWLMAVVRCINHYGKRGFFDGEEGKGRLEYCQNTLSELLLRVDTLEF